MRENKYTSEDLKAMQARSLERKIQVTQTRLIEWYQKFEGKVYVSFSGGKDSTVLLHIARQLYPDIEAVFVDTGLEYPEIRDFVKTVDNVTWLRPEMNFKKVIETYGYPLISKDVAKQISAARRGAKSAILAFDGKDVAGNETEYRKRYKKWKPLYQSDIPISEKCCEIMKKSLLKSTRKKQAENPFLQQWQRKAYYERILGCKTGATRLIAHDLYHSPCRFGRSRMCLSIYADIKCLTPLFMVISLKKTASLKPQGATARSVFSADLVRTLKKSQQGFRVSSKRTRNYIITA